jgi:murein DD-endopeptidase MepM/ murein hydrolase activator NlpD
MVDIAGQTQFGRSRDDWGNWFGCNNGNPGWHYAGGLGLYINGDSGDRWYYAHMDSYAGGIGDGVRVEAGQLVGFVGATGNASVPHLHIAHIAGGTTYINPFPTVAALCW